MLSSILFSALMATSPVQGDAVDATESRVKIRIQPELSRVKIRIKPELSRVKIRIKPEQNDTQQLDVEQTRVKIRI
ncbi:hypothetical protein QWY77_09320 [Thalassotalea ponticola]|uniref:hypothetical protein n=1 Tax=Thalassotalea ponticola TaxID=1523392 RepID=UPI0025B287A0|nr:hypothetical protein [Thalassotalea ponticola]MDN3652956.1 hypothetical protein [Thalassotalea ponticola]